MRLKLFLAYLLILVALPAHAWMGPVMCGGGVAAATCTTPSGTILAEGFEGCATNCGSGCTQTYTVGGTGSKDCSATTPASAPTGSCDNSGRFYPTAAKSYIYWDNGSALTYPFTVTFPLYIDSVGSFTNYQASNLFKAADDTHDYDDGVGGVKIALADSKWYMLVSGGSGGPSYAVEVPLQTWVTIKVTYAATAAESKIQCTSGCSSSTEYTWTRASADARYIWIGPYGGAVNTIDMYIPYAVIN